MALAVHRKLWPQDRGRHAGLLDVYRRIEMPTSDVLGRIERVGVLIDSAQLASQSQELAERMAALEQDAYSIAGQPFNLGSPKQIGEILFGKLGLPVGRKTASGAPSTDEDVLQELAADYPLPAKLLEHRSLSKLKGTYTDKLPMMVNPDDRPRAHQLRAGGGRDRAAYRATIRTCRTSRFARPKAVAFAKRSCRRRGLARFSRPTTRRSSCASWRTSRSDDGLLKAFGERRRRASRDRRAKSSATSVGEVQQRAAALREGDQLWPHLRHERVRPRRQSRHRPHAPRRPTSTATSRVIPA